MNNQSIQALQEILQALMTVNVKGNDAVTLVNCMQALQQVIRNEVAAAQAQPVGETESADVE